ncbi:hypothetical protein KCMC57_up30730 [Kitasatospora sp. CMC57]|uniref:Uncharacterized protein n=1 Tax=Kitasatospora sp. CMC57 TaxID=3231513 RepID=A0AB33K487_9ACTN
MSSVRRIVGFVLVPLAVGVAVLAGTGTASADTIWNTSRAAAMSPDAPVATVSLTKASLLDDTIWN